MTTVTTFPFKVWWKSRRVAKMAPCAVMLFLCVLAVVHKGLAAVIETQQTVMAAVGEEALLNCQLMLHKDVLHVTWWKVLPDEERNVASYHKIYGQKVNDGFHDKVEFKEAGLQNSSIVIKNVTEEDEGCYHCLFNTYPEGAFTGSSCLQLYGVDEESGSDEGDVNGTLITVLVVVVCVCVAASVIIILLIRKHQDSVCHRDSEENKTPQKTTTDTTEPTTPLMSKENEVQQRTSSGKKKENGSLKESSLTAGCQQQLLGATAPSSVLCEETEKGGRRSHEPEYVSPRNIIHS